MRTSYLWGVAALAAVILALLIGVKSQAPEPQAVPSAHMQTATSTRTTTAPSPMAPVRIAVTADSSAKTVAPATATLIVDGANFALHAPAGSTLKTAMDELQSEGGFTYTYKEYAGMGALVTSIQGRAGTNQYWILYVNGKQSDAGISSTHIRSGDVIEWKLEKSK